jgi:hypothetical protein
MFYDQPQVLNALSHIIGLKLIPHSDNMGITKDKKMTKSGFRKVKISWAFSPEDIDEDLVQEADVMIIFSDGIRVPGTYQVVPHENFIGSESLWKEKLRLLLKSRKEYTIIHPDLIKDTVKNKE